jgi:glycosyltransferase involved in cell wall biosynthesis
MTTSSRIVIGLPVYNGENYLAEAIESILAQTYTDFQLLIGDNASTDATPDICQNYVKQDSRVSYYRHPKNLGVSGNSNFLFEKSDAPYFKWHAHDDVIASDYLRRCLDLMEANPDFAIVHSRSLAIDEHGDCIGNYDYEVPLAAERPSDRLWRILWAGYFNEAFGLMRASTLAKTGLFRSFDGSDRNLIMELLLQGNVGYVNDYLFSRRDHPDCYCRQADDSEIKRQWFDPSTKPELWNLKGPMKSKVYFSSILQAPLTVGERLRCLRFLTEWTVRRAVESATGAGEKFGSQFRKEFAASKLWADVADVEVAPR